jgi:hypothetical protein
MPRKYPKNYRRGGRWFVYLWASTGSGSRLIVNNLGWNERFSEYYEEAFRGNT